jgi:hypothetical protein
MKAIKWGVCVGSLFAGHRYYRSRSVNSAAHWFTVMSFVSFFNIWLSFSLQEYVTEYGSRKSISMSQRNEYHQNAYKAYVKRMQNETLSIDELADPILQNDTAQALDTFSDTYAEIVKRRFGTDNVERDVLL